MFFVFKCFRKLALPRNRLTFFPFDCIQGKEKINVNKRNFHVLHLFFSFCCHVNND